MKLEFVEYPTKDEVNLLTKNIENEVDGFGKFQPFAFFMRTNDNTIKAGCNGYIVFGCIYTAQLWVDQEYRRQGFGRKLMEKVHNHGINLECKIATLCTMDFHHAIEFYKILGYEIDFVRNGYANDASCVFLKKQLALI